MELATVLSIATRIEPELIRAVRLRLLPHLDVGAEADLWFCDWVGARTPEAIALLPDCLPFLRAGLVDRLESEPRLGEVMDIVTELHRGLSPALLLEEQVTWDSLSGDVEGATRNLNRALHSLVRENRSGLAGWFAEAARRLPSEALSTATAWSLANAARPHVPSLGPGAVPELTLTTVSSIAAVVGQAPLGVLREGRALLLGKVRGRDAAAVLVPDTSPRVVEVTSGATVRTARVDAAEVVRLDVGTGPVELRTGAGHVYVIDAPAPATPPSAVTPYETLIELVGPGVEPELVARLAQAIRELLDESRRADDPEALRKALALTERVLDAGYDPRDFPGLGCEAAETLCLHGLRLGSTESLERAVRVAERMTDVPFSELSTRAGAVLGAAQRELFCHTGDISQLHRALGILVSKSDRPLGGPAAGGRLISELLRTYVVAHENQPRANDLGRALELTDSVVATSVDQQGFALPRARLLLARYETTGDPADLDRAERLAELAATAQEPRSVQAEWAGVLASVHMARFWWDGSEGALHAALRQSRSAVKLSPDSDKLLRARLRHALSDVLRVRSAVLSEAADLDEAIALAEQAAQSLPVRSVWRMAALTGLSRCLLDSFRRTGAVSALDSAVEATRDVVSRSRHAPELPYQYTALVQQGECLVLRYRETGDSQSLRQAIQNFRATKADPFALSPANQAARTAVYASALLELHALDSSPTQTDLSSALEELHSLLPHDDLDRQDADSEAVSVVLARAAFLSRPPRSSATSLHQAAGRARDVVFSRVALPLQRLRAGLLWGSLAMRLGRWEDVVQSHAAVTRHVPLVLLTSGREQADIMGAWEERSREAAAYAIEVGAPERALEFIEQRSVLLSAWHQGSRAEVDRLRAAAPGLDAELRRLWAFLHLTPKPIASRMHRRQDPVQARLDELVEAMRAIPGFESFLAPEPADRLAVAASEGPVVVLSAAARRCDALLVTRQGVSALPLREVGLADLTDQAGRYRDAMGSGPVPLDGQVVWSVLDWLRESTVGPVLSHLGLTHRTDRDVPTPATGNVGPDRDPSDVLPRVWWCPTGPFTRLPLHLAGQPRNIAMDYAVHSYTSSLQALTTARHRERHPGRKDDQRILMVLADDLPNGTREIAGIHRLVPQASILRGAQATGANVTARLADHPFFHFVGRTRLQDGVPQLRFSADDGLGEQRLALRSGTAGALAYLSIRETDGGDRDFESDGWTVAGSFQAAGFNHVIGLPGWGADAAAADLAEIVYTLLLAPDGLVRPERSAHALHRAVRAAIADSSDQGLALATVVHLGP
ncbi:hypothetical protein [Streptomyces sp. NPDC050263]|uniref:hypothetical protein n=1 Tax=Streptomyces sp. NPDC050263 TaxID=3155037 RepID=UPI00342A3DFA